MAILILSLCLASPQSLAAEKIDLRQALTRAQRNSLDFDVLVRTEKMAQATYQNSWSVFLPEADLEAQNGYNRQGGNSFYTQTTPVAPWSNILGLTINENLYDNGKSWNEMDIASLKRKTSTLGLERGRQQLF